MNQDGDYTLTGDDLPEDWKRPMTAREHDAIRDGEPDLTDPAFVGRAFCELLWFWDEAVEEFGLREVVKVLYFRTYPWCLEWPREIESSLALKDQMASIVNPGWGTEPVEALGAPWLRYMKVMDGVTENYVADSGHIVEAAAIVSLRWLERTGHWTVCGFGDYVPPERFA